jgi:flagellar export protein FliJ
MSAFHFRLETLLRLRMAERDERRADLAKALRAEGLLLGELRQIEVEQLQAQAKVREQSAPGAADVDGLLRTNRYQLVLKSQRGQLESQLAQVRAELERRRLALLEADRGVRVLEKLRERQQAAFRQREERLETKTLDEVAIGAFSRRKEAAT